MLCDKANCANVRVTCIAARFQRLLQAFQFFMCVTHSLLVMYYATPAFTVIAYCCSLDVCRQIINKLDSYCLHQFPPDVILPVHHHCSCLIHIPVLSPYVSFPLLMPFDAFHCPFYVLTTQKFPCMPGGDFKGWLNKDDGLCSSLFFVSCCGYIVLYS